MLDHDSSSVSARRSDDLESSESTKDDSQTEQGLTAPEQLTSIQEGMFTGSCEEQSHCKTFFDLPGEVRNMIYEYVLDIRDGVGWELGLFRGCGRLEIKNPELNFRSNTKAHTATAYISGAINKQIRQESRTMLWSKLEVTILDRWAFEYDLVRKMCMMIDISEMPVSQSGTWTDRDRGQAEFNGFQRVLSSLRFWKSLHRIFLEFHLAYISQKDEDILRTHFTSGEPLVSPGLEKFATAIGSLPRFTSVDLEFHKDTALDDVLSSDPNRSFHQFAFRGMREMKLYQATGERLHVSCTNINGTSTDILPRTASTPFIMITYEHEEPLLGGDKIMDYEAWLEWQGAGRRNWWESALCHWEDAITGIELLPWKEAKDDWSLGLEDRCTLIRGRIFICDPNGTCYLDVVV